MNKYAQRIEELGGTRSIWEDTPFNLTEANIADFEKQLGYTLPADYRECLKDFSDYELRAQYPLENGPIQTGYFHTFLGLKFYNDWHLLLWYNSELEAGYITRELLPIGMVCDFTDPVCLYLDGPRKGQIYMLYRPSYPNPDLLAHPSFKFNESNLYFIANSFDEFMNLLEPQIDEDDEPIDAIKPADSTF